MAGTEIDEDGEMRDNSLLDLYRKKRAVDGLNGRPWDAVKHLAYEKQIELEESFCLRKIFDPDIKRYCGCPKCNGDLEEG